MPRTVSFTLPGEPVAWQRRVVNKRGQQYTPAKARARMAEVRWAFDQAAPGWKPHEGPVGLFINAYLKPPASWPAWRKAGLAEHLVSFVGCCKAPDASNIAKLIEDALNGLAYKDDAQIIALTVHTFWGDEAYTEAALTFYDPPSRENATR